MQAGESARVRPFGKSLAAVVAAISASLVLAVPAGAGVPKKDYACYGEAGTYVATLEIKSATKYRYLGKGGKYRANGKVLKFKKGPLKKWVGKGTRSNGQPSIKLVTDQRGGQTVNCYA